MENAQLPAMRFRGIMVWMVLATQAGSGLAQDCLRVVTLNLWHDRQELQERTRHTQQILAALKPDAVGLQEVSGSIWRPNRARILARNLDYDSHYSASDGTPLVFAEGLAVLSPHSMAASAREKLVHSKPWPFERRFVQWTEITLPSGQSFILLNTHFTHHESEGFQVQRLEQALQVIEVAASEALARDIPAVLVGDLNSEPSQLAIQALTGSLLGDTPPFQDAWRVAGNGPGATSCPSNPYNSPDQSARRLDYVLVLQGTTVIPRPLRAWRIADGRDSEAVSDHYGVAVDLEMGGVPSHAAIPNSAQRAAQLLEQIENLRGHMKRVRSAARSSKGPKAAELARWQVLQWLEARLEERISEKKLAAMR